MSMLYVLATSYHRNRTASTDAHQSYCADTDHGVLAGTSTPPLSPIFTRATTACAAAMSSS